MAPNHYEVLGVSPTAPDGVIRAAYRARMKETHPDTGGSPADAQAVNEAWAAVGTPAARAKYDAARAAEAETAQPADAAEHSERSELRESFAPRATSSERSEPTLYRGDIAPPRSWWKTWPVLTAAAIAAAATAAYAAFAPDESMPGILLVASVGLAITFSAHAHWGFLLMAVPIAVGYLMYGGLSVIAPAAVLVLALVIFLQRRREERHWDTYMADVVLATVEHNETVSLFQVLATDVVGAKTETLVRKAEGGFSQSFTFWRRYAVGDYLAHDPSQAEVLASATEAGMRRAQAAREKKRAS